MNWLFHPWLALRERRRKARCLRLSNTLRAMDYCPKHGVKRERYPSGRYYHTFCKQCDAEYAAKAQERKDHADQAKKEIAALAQGYLSELRDLEKEATMAIK